MISLSYCPEQISCCPGTNVIVDWSTKTEKQPKLKLPKHTFQLRLVFAVITLEGIFSMTIIGTVENRINPIKAIVETAIKPKILLVVVRCSLCSFKKNTHKNILYVQSKPTTNYAPPRCDLFIPLITTNHVYINRIKQIIEPKKKKEKNISLFSKILFIC